ncbi:MAG TPA: hypothetical protein DGB85_11420 [Deltaproteobacteria bacterium]|nr:hypothetical protein [Deltaproteobacteria bacterium]
MQLCDQYEQRLIGMQAENHASITFRHDKEKFSLPRLSSPNTIGSDKPLIIARDDILIAPHQ